MLSYDNTMLSDNMLSVIFFLKTEPTPKFSHMQKCIVRNAKNSTQSAVCFNSCIYDLYGLMGFLSTTFFYVSFLFKYVKTVQNKFWCNFSVKCEKTFLFCNVFARKQTTAEFNKKVYKRKFSSNFNCISICSRSINKQQNSKARVTKDQVF
jgi:hypothetical protein